MKSGSAWILSRDSFKDGFPDLNVNASQIPWDLDDGIGTMILYAKTEEEIQPDNKFMVHGNRISVKTLDLN